MTETTETGTAPKGKKAEPDNRCLAERWCAVKLQLPPGILPKLGRKEPYKNAPVIEFVRNEDLQELIRALMAKEGIDVIAGMVKDRPPIEIKTITKNGTRVEWQVCCRIVSKCRGDKDVCYRWGQDVDLQIAETYAYKGYLLQRLHLAGGTAEDLYLPGYDALPEPAPVGVGGPNQQSNYGPINITPQQQSQASIGGGPRPTGGRGPDAPAEPEEASSPRDPDAQGDPNEIKAAWKAFQAIYERSPKQDLARVLLREINSLNELTNSDLDAIWDDLQQYEQKAPF